MSSKDYDVIIIGSGFGGSASAFKLAKAGKSVLIIERGKAINRDDDDWNPEKILIKKKYQGPEPVFVKQYNQKKYEPVFDNEVIGGASVFYGGASLRLREKDFKNWPFKYEDFEPYYTEAESLLEVHGDGTKDVFDPKRSQPYPFSPIELTTPSKRIYKAAKKLNLSPFPIPLALNFKNKERNLCQQCNTCDGFPCKVNAKNDVTQNLLAQSLNSGAEILSEHLASKLNVKNGKIESVTAIHTISKDKLTLKAKLFILSAGTLQSPALLLRSGISDFDKSGLIGKNLMRHCNAVVSMVFPFKTNPDKNFHKQLCFTDFYEDAREKYGTAVGVIQDIYTPDPKVIKAFAPFGLKNIASHISQYLQNLLCIAEDEPQESNKVSLSEEVDQFGLQKILVQHQYSENDYLRRDLLIKNSKKILKKAGGIKTQIYKIDSFSHALGTLRFGIDPSTSVLNKNCKLHNIENLYVLDGSFMPTSGGVNPSLTITANALRVADNLVNEVL
ncbi:MAG: hypothetical protein COA97_12975 [Flavobacteriales bacterium]|nr:MAG: hypothetical protein COA97_12975 [Flavobacteriales bacterium]